MVGRRTGEDKRKGRGSTAEGKYNRILEAVLRGSRDPGREEAGYASHVED